MWSLILSFDLASYGTLVKQYFRCFSEGGLVFCLVFFFLMRLTFKLVDFEWSSLFYLLWVGLVQSVEDLPRTKTSLLPARWNSVSRWPLDLNCDSSLGLQPASLTSSYFWVTKSLQPCEPIPEYNPSINQVCVCEHFLLIPFLWITLVKTGGNSKQSEQGREAGIYWKLLPWGVTQRFSLWTDTVRMQPWPPLGEVTIHSPHTVGPSGALSLNQGACTNP